MQLLHMHKETHRHILGKFLLLGTIFLSYFSFVSFHYGLEEGFIITWLTWSFFVLCTPVADAGFLIDFPLRLITHIRMIWSELVVWVVAIIINLYTYFLHPDTYMQTPILELFKHILEQPFPFWVIILLSALGTFLSIQFGDELWDVAKHKDRKKHKRHVGKWHFIFLVSVLILTLITYDILLQGLGVSF